MPIVVIPLAYGDIYSDDLLKQPLDPAVARFTAAIEAAEEYRDTTILVCTAGYSRKNATAKSPEREISLAHQLKRYIEEHESRWLKNLVAEPLCWSTRNEIRVGIKRALREGVSRKEKVTLIVASNWSHLVRIRLYTHMYAPLNWDVRYVRAHHHFSLLSHVLEVPKLARDLIYAFRLHRRFKRRYG